MSVVTNLMLVIVCRTTNRETDYYNMEDTRKQLFALLDKTPEQNSFHPFCEKLGEPMGQDGYGSLDHVHYGNAIRSANGKAVEVVTVLPLGNQECIDDDDPRETAGVTAYDILASHHLGTNDFVTKAARY